MILNLPHRLCNKRKYILSGLMLGPQQPGNDINTYFRLLGEDLKELWYHDGVQVWDEHKREYFGLKSILFLAVSDSLAARNLSRHSKKVGCQCPHCNTEKRHPPPHFTGHEVYEMVKDVHVVLAKRKRTGTNTGGDDIWKKQPIFWELPYWKDLDVHQFFLEAIMNFCFLFNAISQKVLSEEALESLETRHYETLCFLEIYFPPAFFDISVHFTTYLIIEVKLLGHVFVHQMYVYERFNDILKSFVRNQAYPEGSMVQGYCTDEAMEWALNYADSSNPTGVPRSHHEGGSQD
jgi:hypothetical protein